MTNQFQNKAMITMNLHGDIVNTRDIPDTILFLEKHYPQVLTTQCFNECNYTFKEEVKKTEIGHLFEHLILEELCSLKIKQGAQKAIFNGVTSWNWKNDARGVFHITIDVGESDLNVLHKAIEKSIALIENLLSNAFHGQPDWLPAELHQ